MLQDCFCQRYPSFYNAHNTFLNIHTVLYTARVTPDASIAIGEVLSLHITNFSCFPRCIGITINYYCVTHLSGLIWDIR